MIRNGLYSLNANSRDGVAEDVGGVLILRDGQLHGGDAYVYYTGSYECSAGNWQGKMTSQEPTPTTRPMAAKVQHIGNRTCRSPASGSRTRLHAFTHDTSCPSRHRRTSPKFLWHLQRCRCQGRCNGPPWRAKHSIRCNAALAGARLNSISLGLSLQFDTDKPGRSGDFRY
jgi:hypothetical protein